MRVSSTQRCSASSQVSRRILCVPVELTPANSLSPTDKKLATCSDDGSVKIFDFARQTEERVLRGHGADVKCIDWHPQKGLIVSGSKDAQQPMKLWDPRSGKSLFTLSVFIAFFFFFVSSLFFFAGICTRIQSPMCRGMPMAIGCSPPPGISWSVAKTL